MTFHTIKENPSSRNTRELHEIEVVSFSGSGFSGDGYDVLTNVTIHHQVWSFWRGWTTVETTFQKNYGIRCEPYGKFGGRAFGEDGKEIPDLNFSFTGYVEQLHLKAKQIKFETEQAEKAKAAKYNLLSRGSK